MLLIFLNLSYFYLDNRNHNYQVFGQISSSDRTLAIQRLTALWALNECGLGGILHAFQSPFTGLLVGSIAMICIALICAFAENKWRAVVTSLFVVLIIKALVSPHSTPTAYIAVIFQAVSGAIIYRYVPNLLAGSLLFVSIGLIESAIQRVLTLTILYGNTLWGAVDIWGEWITDRWNIILPLPSSRLIIYSYLAIHFIAGLSIGWFIYKMILATNRLWGASRYQLELSREHTKDYFKRGRGSGMKWKRYILFLVLMVLIVFAYAVNPGTSNIEKGFLSIFRAIVVLMIWFVFLAPLFINLLKAFLKKKHHQLSAQVTQTMDMMPHLTWIIDKAWKETRDLSFIRRWRAFVIHSLLYILQFRTAYDTNTDGTHR